MLIFIFLLVKSVYPEEKKPFKPRFSIKLTEGWGSVAIGDINRSLKSVNNNYTFEYFRRNYPDYMVGEIKTLETNLSDWEAELRMEITPRISLGVATSAPFQRSNESSATYTMIELQWQTYTYKPKIEVSMPVILRFYYSLLPRSKINILLNAGVGLYTGKMQEFFKLEVASPPAYIPEWITRYWETERKSSFGLQGGAGIEYLLTKRLALVAEFQVRYAAIRNFWGGQLNVSKYEWIYGGQIGYLYYFTKEELFLGARYADIEIFEELPEISDDFKDDFRKAVLDLSGYSFRIGLRIGLF